jgi:hypothetical protein
VDLDALEPAGGRGALQDVAAEPAAPELVHAPPGKLAHTYSVIGPARDAHQAWRGRVAHQPDRLARYAHADLHLGTDRHPRDVARQHAGDVGVLLVAAVVADLLAQQTGRDADPDGEIG